MSLGAITRITIDAANPWDETIAAVPSDQLNRFFADSNSPLVSLTTTDQRQIGPIAKAIARASFEATNEGDGFIDLCYRLTFASPSGSVVLYADAVGNVLRDGRVFRLTARSHWLLATWNAIVRSGDSSYTPSVIPRRSNIACRDGAPGAAAEAGRYASEGGSAAMIQLKRQGGRSRVHVNARWLRGAF
jgi:hypothetical protein